MKIIFSGGGTLGPVTPLLGIFDVLKAQNPRAEFLWVGTKRGPERELVEKHGIPFTTLSSGKFRRYLSFWNITDLVRIIIGFFQSLILLWRQNPDVCISAGGFISVPLHFAAWLLGVPTWVHQQDIEVGLANKLMAFPATVVTTSLEQTKKFFSKSKTVWLGNPVRRDIFQGNMERARDLFQLKSNLPVVFATGGGTGSMKVNQMIVQAVQHLVGVCEVIHLTGKERPQELIAPAARQFSHYHPYQFFTEEMKDAYAVAEVVVSRGGFGTITEVAALAKASILVPKPGHQVENVHFLQQAEAAIFVDEKFSDGNHLAGIIKELLGDKNRRDALGKKLQRTLPPAEPEKIQEIMERIVS